MLLAVRISSYGCTWEVWRALKKIELLSAAPRATLSLPSCSPNFPRAFITRYTHAKHEPILNCNIARLGGALRFPAAVSSLIPTVPSHSSYFSVHEDLKSLFQLTSGASMYLVQPPGTITRSIFLDFNDSVMLSSM